MSGRAADFQERTRVGDVISSLHENHGDFYKLSGGDECTLAARMECRETGRVLEVHTNEPCLQFYTSSQSPEEIRGKRGKIYRRFGAFCLECEGHPGAIGHPQFESHIARPGRPVEHETRYSFSTKNNKQRRQHQ